MSCQTGHNLLQLFPFLFIILSCHSEIRSQSSDKFIFTRDTLLQAIETSCFVAFSTEAEGLLSVFEDVEFAFKDEDKVVVGLVDFATTLNEQSGRHIKINRLYGNATADIAVFPKRVRDRSCLSTGTSGQSVPKGIAYSGLETENNVIEFINQKCMTYRHKHGYLNQHGLHREEILKSLFHVENVSDVSMSDIHNHCSKQTCKDVNIVHSHSADYHQESNDNQPPNIIRSHRSSIHQCDKIELPSKAEFFHEYLKLSKPVIIKNAMDQWPAIRKWTNNYFRKKYGDRKVHIKLTPQGIFEGVDFASEFKNFETFKVPSVVHKQLLFPDLVVVRPATKNMNFSDFIDLIEHVSEGKTNSFSAYLEYSSLANIVSELENDVMEMPFIDRMLKLEHLNMWLSDGKTLGKLHFDPFDNFLCQISGKKEVILFSPHDNTKLYEAHIPEAMLSYDPESHSFVKKKLVDSTSMVMSPVDLETPNYERFPKFLEAYPMNCTIEEGEVLFMPAFWWHEVQSYPSTSQKRNLAVNFWYDPFLTKEFPCQDCKLDVNPNYRHLL